MRILVTGANGRLGSTLLGRLAARGHQPVGADNSGTPDLILDITNFAAVCAAVRDTQPALVLHTAAWTDVDGCARDPEHAILTNGIGTQYVAQAAAAVGAAVLAVSTNEVFDGTLRRPYYEYDVTRPVNPYGYSKWVGEQALLRANPRHYLVRTAWLFAHSGKNFIQAILNAAQAGKPLRVVTDEVANPTYNDDLAAAIVALVETDCYGIYHLVNEGACSRYTFARAVLDSAGYGDVPITPISSSEWQRASVPPRYTPLRNLAGAHLGITLRPWQQAVAAFLEREGLLRR